MHTDPISDMITRIRNACRAKHDTVSVPFSKTKARIAELLRDTGYLETVTENHEPKSTLELKIRYNSRREPVISGIRRLSTPGVRTHLGYKNIPKVRNGLGILILTTSKGMMTDKEARKSKVGGEAVCSVW